MPSLEELREAFAHTREQLHADDSEIFASDIPELPPGIAPESPDSAADGARTASEILAAAPALQDQVESLQRRLADAEQRAQRNAECAQRQVEIHMTLLHAAHDAATESRDETRADAERLREQLATTARELADARERVGLQAERYQAELALVREQAAARAEDGRRALAFVRAEASAERALLAAELRACERAGGGAGAASPLRRRAGTGACSPAAVEASLAVERLGVDPTPAARPLSAHAAGLGGAAGGAMLRELQQWAVDGGDAAAAAAARTAKLHERLARVEAAADAASVGFDALQREHVLLQKRYRKLQRRLTVQT